MAVGAARHLRQALDHRHVGPRHGAERLRGGALAQHDRVLRRSARDERRAETLRDRQRHHEDRDDHRDAAGGHRGRALADDHRTQVVAGD